MGGEGGGVDVVREGEGTVADENVKRKGYLGDKYVASPSWNWRK